VRAPGGREARALAGVVDALFDRMAARQRAFADALTSIAATTAYGPRDIPEAF